MAQGDGVAGLSHDHGHEVTRFVKPGQIIKVMKDGCLIAELSYVQMADSTGHTAHGFGFKDSPDVRAQLIKSGYEEEDLGL